MEFTQEQVSELGELYRCLMDLAEIIIRDRDDAKDAVHDALVRALESDGYDPSRGASFRTWLTSYVISQSINSLRSKRGAGQRLVSLSDGSAVEEVEGADSTSPEDGFLTGIDVDTALSKLPLDEANVLRRIWYEGYTLDELAYKFPEYRWSRYVVHRLHDRARANIRKVLLSYSAD
jgi:RNA polymerase sigma-70 factor (ECF subfamily)